MNFVFSKNTLSPTGFQVKLVDVNKLAVYYTAAQTLSFTVAGILDLPESWIFLDSENHKLLWYIVWSGYIQGHCKFCNLTVLTAGGRGGGVEGRISKEYL